MKNKSKTTWEKSFDEMMEGFDIKLKIKPTDTLKGTWIKYPRELLKRTIEIIIEEELEKFAKKIIKNIQKYLNHCQRQNGMPYCKNCGLSKECIKEIKKYLENYEI